MGLAYFKYPILERTRDLSVAAATLDTTGASIEVFIYLK